MRHLALAGTAFVIAAFSGRLMHSAQDSARIEIDPAARGVTRDPTLEPTTPLPWDDPELTAQMIAVLEDNIGPRPDLRFALHFISAACRAADPIRDPPTMAGDWRTWQVPTRSDQSLMMTFARGKDEGMDACRVCILLAPFVAVSKPFQAAGSLMDVKVRITAAGLAEAVVVVCSAPDKALLPFHMEGELPELTLGHRFRFRDDGKLHAIRYWGELRHEGRSHVIKNNFGSAGFEYDAGTVERGMASTLLAWIERHIPGDD